MTSPEYTSARLLFRVDPIPLESPRGYMCRVASAYHYQRPKWLMRLAGFSNSKPHSIAKTALAALLIYCDSNPTNGLPCAIGWSRGGGDPDSL